MKLTKCNEIIQMYHTALKQALKDLEYNGYIPTLFELHKEYIDKIFFRKILQHKQIHYLRLNFVNL